MGKNGMAKGKAGERELAEQLRSLGLGDGIRRGQQYSGMEAPDIVGLDGIHPECKRQERLNIQDAMLQAVTDCLPGVMPAVFHRQNRTPWLVTMRLTDWVELYKQSRRA
ncbi:MAG: hypothetical protein UY48_C0013G0034 [Candidatus Gottesmanbacteria bacterium GW2011_GWB1_49_7]|uniref:Uncharacterized protein n=1 Tax=Candidatus Gottesmanbacteria bacterium GW2011_GWB1_49_7 TaxID=1618448 RepID=A0A0G1VZ52_9BACT|nr:MAG: hypothetical protein UY48_C0013G0034 [Candidatus Gottesmanbacteria bacterium GW2011_GWB1_49_7]